MAHAVSILKICNKDMMKSVRYIGMTQLVY